MNQEELLTEVKRLLNEAHDKSDDAIERGSLVEHALYSGMLQAYAHIRNILWESGN